MNTKSLLSIALTCLTLVLLAFAMWPVVLFFIFDVRELGFLLLAIPLWLAVAVSVLFTWRSYAAGK